MEMNLCDEKSYRLAFLKRTVLFGMFLFVGTEVLSYFHWLTFQGVLVYWAVVCLIFLSRGIPDLRRFKDEVAISRNSLKSVEVFMLVATFLFGCVLAVIAFSFPPNNFDSMTYHMPRVMHWIQNRSVDYYSTNIMRQLWSGPMAEYIILHLQLLFSSDRLANGVQWFSMVGCCLGTSLVAQLLGATRKSQILTAFLTITIPMGILQSTSTQNDYVVGLWLVSLLIFLVFLLRKNTFKYALYAGGALGLGLLTKGTAYIYGGLMVMFFVFAALKQSKIYLLRWVFVICAVALVINLPHYLRNYDLGGHILSPTPLSKKHPNEDLSAQAILSLLARNTAIHLDTPIKSLNKGIENFIDHLHKILNVDINDPRSSLTSFGIHKTFDEDISGNFRHFLFFIISLVLFAFQKKDGKRKNLLIYCSYLLLTFVFFSAYLKYQVWGSRLHLPLFILMMPFMGIVLGGLKRNSWIIFLVIVFMGCSVPWVLKNPKKRLVSAKKTTLFNASRDELIFITDGDQYPVYQDIVKMMGSSGCRDIGLVLGADHWEYPWWVFLKKEIGKFKMEHVKVNNLSSQYLNPKFQPCALIVRGNEVKDVIVYKNKPFEEKYHQKDYSLYVRSKVF